MGEPINTLTLNRLWFLYPIERFIEKRKKERYERWLKTPEGRKEKYKHLFKDA